MKITEVGTVGILGTKYEVIKAVCETKEEQLKHGVYLGWAFEPAPWLISEKGIVVYFADKETMICLDSAEEVVEKLLKYRIGELVKEAFESELGMHAFGRNAEFTEGGKAWKIRNRVYKLFCKGMKVTRANGKNRWIISYG